MWLLVQEVLLKELFPAHRSVILVELGHVVTVELPVTLDPARLLEAADVKHLILAHLVKHDSLVKLWLNLLHEVNHFSHGYRQPIREVTRYDWYSWVEGGDFFLLLGRGQTVQPINDFTQDFLLARSPCTEKGLLRDLFKVPEDDSEHFLVTYPARLMPFFEEFPLSTAGHV